MQQKSYRALSKRITDNKDQIKSIKNELKENPPRPSVKDGKYEISLRKCIVCPEWKNKTVLTDSSWRYVEIFLSRKGQKEALFYWSQASSFHEASQRLSTVSKPLTVYYCFLNATKALLTSRNIPFKLKHGVSGSNQGNRFHLHNEIITLQPKGILSGLCNYLGEPIIPPRERYSLKDILYNLPYIHRSFVLTYRNMTEIFIPIEYARFVYDKDRKKAWLEIELEEEYSNKTTINKLIGFSIDKRYDNSDYYTIRRNKTFDWDAPRNIPTLASYNKLKNYYDTVRKQMRYIYPYNTWYIKRKDITSGIIDKGTLTLTYAAMHRLSELSRYDPQRLMRHLETSSGWLLSEFIDKSIYQFIDQIASEITGDDFRPTSFK